MTQKIINRGSSAGDGQGENAFIGFGKCNDNFTELYNTSPTGGANGQSIFYATTYGAVFDGSTDDTVAINNCIATARAQFNTGVFNSAAIVFPARSSGRISGTINATGFNNEGKNVTIYGNGSTIYLNGNAIVPVWDMMGTKNMHIKDLSLYASSGFQTYGLQCGRIDATTQEGRQNTFEHVNVSGSYTQAAMYNLAGEDNIYIDCYAQNTNTGSGYGFVQDGENHFNITSAFVTQTIAADTPQSFNCNTVLGGKFQSVATGYTPIWLQGTTGHHFIDAYANNAGPAGNEACITLFHIDRVGVFGNHRGLHLLGMHCEANGNPKFYIVHDGPGFGGAHYTATPIISGLEITEPYLSTATSVFHKLAAAGLTSITYEDLKLDLPAGPPAGFCRVFSGTVPPDVVSGGYVHTYKALLWDAPSAGIALNVAGTMSFSPSTGTVASLPTAATAGAGSQYFVSDATATTFASIVAGGGANNVPVYSDGVNWRIG